MWSVMVVVVDDMVWYGTQRVVAVGGWCAMLVVACATGAILRTGYVCVDCGGMALGRNEETKKRALAACSAVS
jgi:hypothetical protein